ncbi:hypothetical protein ACO0LG_18005 [Undibacterium sp. Ji42W]|uniref:hypothetical protein n=1 Tax=Undibacterium sp. Ji42W TaxID=3413039 RepID=UPI003BF31623
MSRQVGDLEGEIILRKAERRLNAKATLSENYRRGPNAIYSGLAAVAAYFFLKPLPIPDLLVILLVCLVSVVVEVCLELYMAHKKLNAAIELLQLQETTDSDSS